MYTTLLINDLNALICWHFILQFTVTTWIYLASVVFLIGSSLFFLQPIGYIIWKSIF